MAGKISTLILTVDLDCYVCSKKIKKTIFKLQGREQIQTVTFDEKSNTVTISGLFDPQKLKKKLLCKACKVIKEIKIKEEKPKPAEPEKEKPKPQDKEPEKEKPKPPPKEPEKEKQKPPPKEPEKEQPKPPPVQGCPPVGPVWPARPSCCWRPCYEQYYGGCRCCSCGMFFGWTAPPPLPAGGCTGMPYASTCQFFCEEDPSCIIM